MDESQIPVIGLYYKVVTEEHSAEKQDAEDDREGFLLRRLPLRLRLRERVRNALDHPIPVREPVKEGTGEAKDGGVALQHNRDRIVQMCQ
jgi:hypothetical protein